MKPIDFPEAVKVLRRPSSMAEDECQSLPVWNDGKQCVSCWRASFKERIQILFRGKVWLGVLSGKSQPPVFLSGEEVFEKSSILGDLREFWVRVKESVASGYKSLRKALKQPDKWKHFIIGFITSYAIGVFVAWWLGFIAAAVAGGIKEWLDSKGHGHVELLDFVFTIAGAAVAVPFAVILNNLIF